MKFYELKDSVNPSEIGSTYPQSQSAKENISVDHPRHLWKQGAGLLTDVVLPEPVIHPKAKLSDLLSTTATWRLVMGPKLKDILQKYILPGQCQFLEMTVHNRSKRYQYWMLNPLRYNMDLINYSASECWLCGIGDTKIQQLDVSSSKSLEEYEQTVRLPERVTIFNVTLIDNPAVDFIQLRSVPGIRYLVSEKLKDAIMKEGCTGIAFAEMK